MSTPTHTPSQLKLQMNLKGSWRDVVSFAPAMEASIKTGAEQLFGHDQQVTLRIISPADSGPPLACWSAATGWRTWGERSVARDPAERRMPDQAILLAEADEKASAILRMQPRWAPELRRLHSKNVELLDALETLCNGLEWNIENHPTVMNGSDEEMLADTKALLQRYGR